MDNEEHLAKKELDAGRADRCFSNGQQIEKPQGQSGSRWLVQATCLLLKHDQDFDKRAAESDIHQHGN